MVGHSLRNQLVVRMNHRGRGDHIFVCFHQDRESADIDRLRAVVVDLDEIDLRKVRMREDFVDHDRGIGRRRDRLQAAG